LIEALQTTPDEGLGLANHPSRRFDLLNWNSRDFCCSFRRVLGHDLLKLFEADRVSIYETSIDPAILDNQI